VTPAERATAGRYLEYLSERRGRQRAKRSRIGGFVRGMRFAFRSQTVLLVCLVAVGLLVIGSPADARRDRIPPKFAGLQSATTCIPGPIGGGRTTSYHLRWDPATDNVTPSSRIVYDVYQATTPGGEDFATPTYTTAPGATAFDTPPLATDKTFYFVVRARDRAGNRDSNTVERQGQNLCV
jgi:hypothetical protein